MKPFQTYLVFFALVCCLGLIQCETNSCPEVANEIVGDEVFTVSFLNEGGGNYLDGVLDSGQIVVFLDTAGSKNAFPDYELIRPGYKDGNFGPFRFTERFLALGDGTLVPGRLEGKKFKFDYFIKRGELPLDTLTVEFLLSVDECKQFWSYIRYSHNGDTLGQYDMVQQAEIVIQN